MYKSDISASYMITTGSKTYQFDKSKCLFCNCIRKNNDIKSINVSSPIIQDTIVDILGALENHELLTKVYGIDLIAAEAKYHKNCSGNALTKSSRKQMASGETWNQSDYVFEKAFNILVDEINDDLMNGVAFEMSHVLETYRVKLHSLGYVKPTNIGLKN